jgi:3-dehydroquinate synthase
MPARKVTYKIGPASVLYVYDGTLRQLKLWADPAQTVLITDENVHAAHHALFRGWNTIVLKPGEPYKVQATVDAVIEQLIEMGADRKTVLVGVGGGVVTDMTGYIASVYMRGIRFGFIPSSLLAMVDASIGGKNGIDVGIYKNMVGTIRQPSFLLFDQSLLASLPEKEWVNGFAEIIKHAAIKDAAMFRLLETKTMGSFQGSKRLLSALIGRNVLIKTRIVQRDEWENGDRRLLNFGHTLGHALENSYELSHGQAISIGMTYAACISAMVTGFRHTERLTNLLNKYGLPTYATFDKARALEVLQKDKKKIRDTIHYVLLEKIGKGVIRPLTVPQLRDMLDRLP